MKKFIIALLACVVAAAACQKTWTWSGDLNVNTTRINLSSQTEGEFPMTVFSNTTWEALVTQGADWLKLEETSGEGIATIHLTYGDNLEDAARIGKLVLTASTGTVVTVNVVQTGNTEKADTVPDYML